MPRNRFSIFLAEGAAAQRVIDGRKQTPKGFPKRPVGKGWCEGCSSWQPRAEGLKPNKGWRCVGCSPTQQEI